MDKKTLFFITILGLLIATQVKAVCPVCTIAVGAGIGLAEWLGIDDTIAGLWIGGFIVSLIIWTISWLNKKNIRFKGRAAMITVAYYLITILPLRFAKNVWHPLNEMLGMNKLIMGVAIGSIFFFAGTMFHGYLRKKNGGKVHFPFQKVIVPISPLIVLSIIFYFITK